MIRGLPLPHGRAAPRKAHPPFRRHSVEMVPRRNALPERTGAKTVSRPLQHLSLRVSRRHVNQKTVTFGSRFREYRRLWIETALAERMACFSRVSKSTP